jgi:hypothetical protein
MLREITDIRQDNPDVQRRWFHDDYFDLYVWQSPGAGIVGFQLCYDIHSDERVLSWHETSGYSHNRIDAGEATPMKNMTPILVTDGQLPIDDVLPRFLDHSRGIEPAIGEFVLTKLRDYAKRLPPPGTAPARTSATR